MREEAVSKRMVLIPLFIIKIQKIEGYLNSQESFLRIEYNFL